MNVVMSLIMTFCCVIFIALASVIIGIIYRSIAMNIIVNMIKNKRDYPNDPTIVITASILIPSIITAFLLAVLIIFLV